MPRSHRLAPSTGLRRSAGGATLRRGPVGGGMVRVRASGTWLPVLADATSGAAADTLATELGRLASPAPARPADTGQAGILLRASAHDPQWDFRIAREGNRLVIEGDARALTLGSWHLLRMLGHRALAPTTEWEILPAQPSNVDITPPGNVAYRLRFTKGLGDGCGIVGTQQTRLDTWRTRVGLVDDGVYGIGHAWPAYVSQGAPDPAWVVQPGNKLHAELSVLRDDFVLWAADRYILQGLTVVSVAASDGINGWSSIPVSASTAQALIANAVDSAGYPCSILAYGYMSAQPSIPVNVNVLVIVASAFMQYGMTEADVHAAYVAAGARRFGLYGYPHVWTFAAKDLPGAQRSGLRSELEVEIARLRRDGIEGWSGEGGPAWAACGRWYYALAGWTLGEDPLTRWDAYPGLVFPSAPVQATAWYAEVCSRPEGGGATYSVTRSSAVRALALALLDSTPAGTFERTRALDLGRYAVAQELWRQYWHEGKGPTRLEAYLRWCYRIRDRDLCSFRCPYFDSVLDTDRQAVAALYSLPDLTPSSGVWADVATTESEVRGLLVA